jgi:hypothetical protein
MISIPHQRERRVLLPAPGQHPVATHFERHFSPRTLAELWSFSEDTIVRWFEEEAGVLKCGQAGNGRGRGKVSLRIPESVALRIYQERTR